MLSWRMKASETVIAHYLGVLKSIRYRFFVVFRITIHSFWG